MPRSDPPEPYWDNPAPEVPLATRAHAALGRLLFAYSRLDVNLALYVANHLGNESRSRELERLETTSFKDKLALVLPSTDRWYKEEHQCREDWEHWLIHADQLRLQRNDLVHGRWGVVEWHKYIVNVVGLPGSPNQRETQYSIEELDAEANQAEALAQEFLALTKRWPT